VVDVMLMLRTVKGGPDGLHFWPLFVAPPDVPAQTVEGAQP
jgi:hypothetical protein